MLPIVLLTFVPFQPHSIFPEGKLACGVELIHCPLKVGVGLVTYHLSFVAAGPLAIHGSKELTHLSALFLRSSQLGFVEVDRLK